MNRSKLRAKDETVNRLERNIKNRFKELLSKPRISVKCFAKIKLEEPHEDFIDPMVPRVNKVSNPEMFVSVSKNPNNRKRIVKNPSKQPPRGVRINPTEEHFKEVSLKLSEEQHINESIYCELCSETFKNSVDFSVHSIIHNDNKKYSCHACGYKTISKRCIEQHVKAHEGKSLYNCEICKKGFTKKDQAAAHKNLHTGEKPFMCDICGNAFTSTSILSNHRRYRHWKVLGLTPAKYDCKMCDKSFLGHTSRARHIKREHTQGFDESELCDICGKRLSSKQKLKFHKRTHTGYKPHACTVCEKTFCKKERLTEHLRVHSGEKPHKCKHCGKGFTQRSSLRIHERIHTGERPYMCHLCKKGFISKGVLDLHFKKCEGVTEDSN